MKWLEMACWAVLASAASVSAGGLDAAAPIGPYLDGALPSRAPTATSGAWELVNAFPHLVVVDPIQMLPVPRHSRLMVAERWGALVVFPNDPETSERKVVLDLSSHVEGSGDSGLLGLTFHPEFGQEGSPNRDHLYVFYRHTPDRSEKNRAYGRLSRFTWQGDTDAIDPSSELVLINQYDRHNWHAGGGMLFGNDGFLYLSFGDEGGTNDAFGVGQRRDRGLFSGVIRIDVDQDPSRSHPIRRQPSDPEAPPPGWPASFTQGYFIPDDNPWPSPDGSQLEEFWVIGARSPYRMTLDPPTGHIWLGDVGQSLEEEINLLERGANLQWPYREGNRAGPAERPTAPEGIESPPLLTYGRGEGGCIVGGYVYRGAEHPSLVGKYLFGDFNNGQVRSLTHTPGQPPVVEDIARLGDRQLIAFGHDAEGELYLLTIGQTFLNGGIIYKLKRSGEARPQPPATLSATGAFADLVTLAPRPGLMPYDLIQPLWSDGSDKMRWIAIPNDGTPDSADEQVVFSETEPWQFPTGTVLVKHFAFEGRRLETRFLIKGEEGRYFGFTYRWRPDHSDADLLPGPAVDEIVPLSGGRELKWHFPARIECFACHSEAAGIVLGPRTRQLNRDLLYPETGRIANQIETWSELGFFANPPDPSSVPGLLKSANLLDDDESLDRRARSYLDSNCAQCHVPGGPTQSSFDARLTTPPHHQNLVNVDPGNGFDLVDPKIIKPGDPALSVLLFRLGTLDDCCAMPPIAKNAVDSDAVRVLTEWVRSLDPVTSPTGPVAGPPPGDLTLPQVDLALAADPAEEGFLAVSVTASEPVVGLSLSDFTITNGVAVAFEGSGTEFTLTILPRLPGPGTVDLASDRLTDLVGNANRRLPTPFSFVHEGAAPLNRLSNGDFETGLDGWSQSSASLVPLGLSGSRAAALAPAAFLTQTLPVVGEELYRLSLWSRADADGGAAATATVSFWDAAGQWLGERNLALPDGPHHDSLLLDLTAPAAATTASITLLGGGSGQAFVDEVHFSEGGGGSAPSGPLTDNGDFERGLLHWTVTGDVSVSSQSHLGEGAARLGEASSATFERPILPRSRVVLTGTAFTEGDPAGAEAGLSFWSERGDLLGSRATAILPSTDYTPFFFFADVPEGSVRLSIWIRNPGGGAVTVDDLGLVHVFEEPAPDPLLPTSANLSPASHFEMSRHASPGSEFHFSGTYLAEGGSSVREAGLTFRDRSGAPVGESVLVLAAGPNSQSFALSATAPAEAASVSAWIFQGEGGTLAVDPLELVRTAPDEPEPSGAHAGAHVRLGSLAMRAALALRDPSPPAPLPPLVESRTQPDLSIQMGRGRLLGEGIHNLSGAGQTALVRLRSRRSRASGILAWQNGAPALADAARLHTGRPRRSLSVHILATHPLRRNVTAALVAGRHVTPEAAPNASARYRMQLRRTGAAARPRHEIWIRADSIRSPARRDLVKIRIR